MFSPQVTSAVLRRLGSALLIASALLLGGCAAFAPPRPYTTEAEALADRGEPTRRWDNGDGTTTLEYSTQPYGDTCIMVQVDAGGIVLRQWDALDYKNLATVQKGMSKDEISRLLGEHRSEQTFRLSGEEVWDWNVYNDGPGIATLFNVHFKEDKVVRTSRSYVHYPDSTLFPPWGMYPYGYYPYGYPYYPPRLRPVPLRPWPRRLPPAPWN